jgi:hypothetical protein
MSSRPLAALASLVLMGLSLLVLLPDCASACSCALFGGSSKQRAERMLDKSGAVFAGKVVDLKRNQKAGSAVLTRCPFVSLKRGRVPTERP